MKNRFFHPKKNLIEELNNLFEFEKKKWNLLRENLEALKKSPSREIEVKNFKFKLSLNERRKKNITKDISQKSLSKNKCVLCPQNLPEEEKGIIFLKDYLLLVNPYPILNHHFVASSIKHKPQLILPHTKFLFTLFEKISKKFFLIYNGPKCGASQPDHFHLQFCDIKELEVSKIYSREKFKEGIGVNSIYPIPHIYIKCKSIEEIMEDFLKIFKKISNSFREEEPPLNLILFELKGHFYLLLFLRKKHRPSFFYEEGDKKILISPGAIDLSGTFVTPEEKHFKRVNGKILEEIISEVVYEKKFLEKFL